PLLSIECSLLSFLFYSYPHPRNLHSFPTRRSSDLHDVRRPLPGTVRPGLRPRFQLGTPGSGREPARGGAGHVASGRRRRGRPGRSEEHTSELQSRFDLVCRLLLEKKKEQVESLYE